MPYRFRGAGTNDLYSEQTSVATRQLWTKRSVNLVLTAVRNRRSRFVQSGPRAIRVAVTVGTTVGEIFCLHDIETLEFWLNPARLELRMNVTVV